MPMHASMGSGGGQQATAALYSISKLLLLIILRGVERRAGRNVAALCLTGLHALVDELKGELGGLADQLLQLGHLANLLERKHLILLVAVDS